MVKTTLKISPEKVKGQISKYFFGHFLEYMHDCIDPGLWAQLLLSRGFENPEEEEQGISSPWKHYGNDTTYSIDNEIVYTPRQSQCIQVNNSKWEGVYQDDLRLVENEAYQGYIWAYCEQETEIKIVIKNKEDQIFAEKIFKLEAGSWKKYNYVFRNKDLCEDAQIFYLVHGPGKVWLDQTSLCPESAVKGNWPEVMDYIKNLKPGIMRFPGGCAADCYFWKEGVGSRDLRPGRCNEHWGGIEQNQFGTDEFIEFCREINCEPLICVNFGSATPEEAAEWVEYCNGSIDTKYGKLRAENGHSEPYGVKYWEIGNEVFGEWEIGHCNAEEYAKKYLKFAKAMREKDQSIVLLACAGDGGNTDQEWNQTVLEICGNMVDQLSLHLYAPLINSKEYEDESIYQAVTAFSEKAEKVFLNTFSTMEEKARQVPLAITEWNCNYGEEDGTNREQTLESAISNAGLLHLFLRNSDRISMTNVSDLINGWPGGIIRSRRGQAFGTVSYYLLQMYIQAQLKSVVDCSYNSECFHVEQLGNIMEMKDVSYLDIVCCKDVNDKMKVFAINRHRKEKINLAIPGWKITGGKKLWHENSLAMNTWEEQEKIIPQDVEDCGEEIELLPHAVYLLNIRKK